MKPITEMSTEELRAAIRDPIGPDYIGYRLMAQEMLVRRGGR